MEIKDLAGLSEPLTRLIEVISKGVGGIAQPYLIKKNADAKAHEITVISEALNDVASKNKLPVVYSDGEIEIWQKPEDKTLVLEATKVDDRAGKRIDYLSRKQQMNVENVTASAAIELANDTTVPPESPTEDWITRFFKYAEDISTDQMQELWGRILAGEIRAPGTYSLRTLDFIRNLTKADANLLEKIGRHAISWSGTSFIPGIDKNWLETTHGIYAGDYLHLAELDVMYPSELAMLLFHDDTIKKEHFFSGDNILVVERNQIIAESQLVGWKFTNTGAELLALINESTELEFLERLGQHLIKRKGKASLATVTARLPDGRVSYNVTRELIPEEE